MPSIFKVGVFAITSASTAFAHVHGGFHYLNTTAYPPTGIITGTGSLPTGYVPTGYVPTGGPGSSSASAPYGNSTIISSYPPTTTAPPHTATSIPGVSYTTSTHYITEVETITACPPAVTKCPGIVVTRTIPQYTTVCPVTDVSPEPTHTVIPVPPQSIKSTIYITNVHTVTAPGGGEHVSTTIYTSVTEHPYTSVYPPHTVAPYPTGSHSFSTIIGTAPVGSGTGVVKPTSTPYAPGGVLTVSAVSPPKSESTYTPPILDQTGAAGKMGVSSALVLALASAFALLW